VIANDWLKWLGGGSLAVQLPFRVAENLAREAGGSEEDHPENDRRQHYRHADDRDEDNDK